MLKKIYNILIVNKIYNFILCTTHKKEKLDIFEVDLIYKIHHNDFQKITLDKKTCSIIKSNKKTVFEIDNEFNLSPGLYRIVNPTTYHNYQFLVKSEDIFEDMQNYMYMFSRGNRHDALSFVRIKEIIRTQRAVLTCGYVSLFMIRFLEENYKNLQTRIVHFLTKEKFNNYNNGHTMLEYYSEKYTKWVAVDFTRSSLFFNENVPLSAYELYVSEYVKPIMFNNAKVDVNFSDCNYNYGFFEDYSYSQQGFKNFHDRILGSIIIAQEKSLYTPYDEMEYMNRLKNIYPEMLFLSKEEFKYKFYGADK